MTNQDEKKNESEQSLTHRLRQQLRRELDKLEPVVSQASAAYRLANHALDYATKNEAPIKDFMIYERNFTAINLSLYEEIIRTVDRDYILTNIIEELENQFTGKSKETSTKMAEDATKEFKTRIANLLAKLFDDSGHEAMYGTGGKR